MSELRCDVAVIGAGPAGLCAAADLCRQEYAVVVLEARDRIGGRIATRIEPGVDYPIELGAEFIHGEAPLTHQLLRAAGIAAVDCGGERVVRREGAVRARADEFGDMRRLLARAAALPEDLSVEQFLARYADGPQHLAQRSMVRRMVEGFDAADPQLASVKAIAAEWGGHSLGGQYRPLGGYTRLLAAFAHALDAARARLLLGTPVQRVDWGGSRVLIQARAPAGELVVSARRAIVSVPLSALRAAEAGAEPALRFEPALHDKQAALAGLALGTVIKVVLQFRRAFWEQIEHGRFADAGFLHAPEAAFPTLWTALPFRVPLLTAWLGGPRAHSLLGADRTQLIERAIESVQQVLNVGSIATEELVAGHVHDWNADPYARGAYCYLTVGGQGAPAALAQPLGAKLFFAGEATSDDYIGTVEAALQSGRRAAQALMAAAGAAAQ